MEYQASFPTKDMMRRSEFGQDYTLGDSLKPILFQCMNDICPKPTTGLGALQCLPNELVQDILGRLDLRSLTNFLSINRRAFEQVHALPHYRDTINYSRATVRSLIAADTAKYFTCTEVYKTLCSWQCSECGQFGEYLHLLLCKRLCFVCLWRERKYLPLSVQKAHVEFGLPLEVARALPQMKFIPGVYSPQQTRVEYDRFAPTLVDREAARNAGLELFRSEEEMKRRSCDIKNEMDRQCTHSHFVLGKSFEESYEEAYKIDSAPEPLTDVGHEHRFMAACRVPWLVRERPQVYEVNWGVCCGMCVYRCNPPYSWRRVYNEESLKDHLIDSHGCEEVVGGEQEEHGLHGLPGDEGEEESE